MTKIKLIAKMMIALVLTSGCASSGITDKERAELYSKYIDENKLESLEKITSFRFQGWNSLDNKHLIISTRISEPYFITLKNSCLDLKWAQGIVVHNASTSSLNSRFDSISVVKFPRHKCFINSIHKLTREQAKAIRKLGKKE